MIPDSNPKNFVGFNPSYGLHALRAAEIKRLGAEQDGFNPSYGLHALRAEFGVHFSCPSYGFNPSYGLHALRARARAGAGNSDLVVSIPHMGCMPYGHNWQDTQELFE